MIFFKPCLLLGVVLVSSGLSFGQTVIQTDSQTDVDMPSAKAQSALVTKFKFEKKGAITYRTLEDCEVNCDVYQPEGDQPMPAIIMIHGGAWRHGSKIAMLRHARRMARVGYVVVSIDYRLAPKYPWPAQIEDCQYAVKWVKHHAADYQIDASRIGVFGYSAGGHLAALLGTTGAKDDSAFSKTPVDADDPIEKLSPHVDAVAIGGAPCEFSWLDGDSSALSYWMGGNRKSLPEKYARASPLTYVTPDDSPFFVFHGTNDWLVPIKSAEGFAKELKKKSVEAKFLAVDGLGHMATFSKTDLLKEIIPFFDRHLRPDRKADK